MVFVFLMLTSSLFPSTIDTYFVQFSRLKEEGRYEEILLLEEESLKEAGRENEKALILAELASTSFYQGKYSESLNYSLQCQNLAEKSGAYVLMVRGLYLESACYRALAAKNNHDQDLYYKAVFTGEKAMNLYKDLSLEDPQLWGKIAFNLGASYADNPCGNLERALSYYQIASFYFSEASDSYNRTQIRIGKVYLQQKRYELVEALIAEVKSREKRGRILMHLCLLEANLYKELGNVFFSLKIAKEGLEIAKTLGAIRDLERFEEIIHSLSDQ